MRIVIPGNPVSKKNSQVIVRTKAGRPYIIPSKAYRVYADKAKSHIPRLDAPVSIAVNIKCIYYMGNKRKVDLTNLLEATDDILVKYGIIADDNSNIVAGHDGSRVCYDKEKPRVEIEISLMT